MLLTNPTWLGSFLGAAGTAVLGVSTWLVNAKRKRRQLETQDYETEELPAHRPKNQTQLLLSTVKELKDYMREQTSVMQKIASGLEEQNIRSEFRHEELVRELARIERGQA